MPNQDRRGDRQDLWKPGLPFPQTINQPQLKILQHAPNGGKKGKKASPGKRFVRYC